MGCEICHGKEFILTSTGNEQIYVPCKCRIDKDTKNINKNKLIIAGIPKDYWDFTEESYRALPCSLEASKTNSKSTAIISGYIHNTGKMMENFMDVAPRVLWIYGGGTPAGRTTWAVILAKALLQNPKHRVKFIIMQDLLNSFIDFESKKLYFEELNKHNIFIIDNAFSVGRFYIKGDYTKVNLYNWLNNILNDGKFLICTSNVPIQSIENIYSECRNVLYRKPLQLELKSL
jgi:DNA replication protein DnaC